MAEVCSKTTKVNFEWKIQIPIQGYPDWIPIGYIPDWLNLQSPEFSAKETPWRMWFLKLQDSIVELQVSSGQDDMTPEGGGAHLGFIDKKNQKVFGVGTNICAILPNPLRLKINLKELEEKDCIVDGYLTVHCEIQERFEFYSKGNTSPIPDSFCGDDPLVRSPYDTQYETLFENMELTDVDFDVCGREFKAHKMVLSRSEEFAAMFKRDTKEKKSNRFVIQDIEPDVFHELLRYIYTGRVPQDKMDRLAVGLLVAANKYLLDQLKIDCKNHLTYRMSPDNCLDLLVLQHENHPARLLWSEALNFFHLHSEKVMASIKWKVAKEKNPILLCDIQKFLIRLNINYGELYIN